MKNKFRIRRFRFYSVKLNPLIKLNQFKNPHRLPTEPMGIDHSPHIHTKPIPMGIPMGIPIPTAALIIGARQHYMLSALYAIARPSVRLCLSVRRVYHRKAVEVRIM